VHRVPFAVQTLLQHGCPSEPQVPQLPFEHAIALTEHIVPEAAHVPPPALPMPVVGRWQHPPPLHPPRSQHGCPAPPHAAHTVPLQTAPSLQKWPGQHGCPGAPLPPGHEPTPLLPPHAMMTTTTNVRQAKKIFRMFQLYRNSHRTRQIGSFVW
jgi:hypothetical protein